MLINKKKKDPEMLKMLSDKLQYPNLRKNEKEYKTLHFNSFFIIIIVIAILNQS